MISERSNANINTSQIVMLILSGDNTKSKTIGMTPLGLATIIN